MHNILATVFHNKDGNCNGAKYEKISKTVQVLKSSLSLIEHINSNKGFSKKLVFGFLDSEPVLMSNVNLFVDIFMTYARYAPDEVTLN